MTAIAKSGFLPENLDFTAKKQNLRDAHGPAYARMLSSLPYSSFDDALASACCRSGVWLKRVNPAFTSLIGRVKFASRYGLGVHAAAALSIARRAMGASEKSQRLAAAMSLFPGLQGSRADMYGRRGEG
ncbi:hypothetical protein GOB57_24515 [Sinorhizobium meliloti]|nr:hypothetical protein [Sinorhizobium meliloti]